MSRSPARSGKAMAMKSLKEKWLSIVQLVREKGENGIGGFSTVTDTASKSMAHCMSYNVLSCSDVRDQ